MEATKYVVFRNVTTSFFSRYVSNFHEKHPISANSVRYLGTPDHSIAYEAWRKRALLKKSSGQFRNPQKILEHDTRVLAVGRVVLYTLALKQVWCIWPQYVYYFLAVIRVLAPCIEHAGSYFNVILQAVCPWSNTKGLVGCVSAECQSHAALGDLENVHVPVKDQLRSG